MKAIPLLLCALALGLGGGCGGRSTPPPEVKTQKPRLNALCPACGLAFRTRLPARERTRCPRCDVVISVRRARTLFSLRSKGADRWTN